MADLEWKLPKEIFAIIMSCDSVPIYALVRVCWWFSGNIPLCRYHYVDLSHVGLGQRPVLLRACVHMQRAQTRALKLGPGYSIDMHDIVNIKSLTSLDGLPVGDGKMLLTMLPNLVHLRINGHSLISMEVLLKLTSLTSLNNSCGLDGPVLFGLSRLTNLTSLWTHICWSEDLRSMTNLLSLGGTVYTERVPHTLTSLDTIKISEYVYLPNLLSLRVEGINNEILGTFTTLKSLTIDFMYVHDLNHCFGNCDDSCNDACNDDDISDCVLGMPALTYVDAPAKIIDSETIFMLSNLIDLNVANSRTNARDSESTLRDRMMSYDQY